MELQDIKSMTLAEIQESFTNDKLPKFRALRYINGCIAAQNHLTKCQIYQKNCVSN